MLRICINPRLRVICSGILNAHFLRIEAPIFGGIGGINKQRYSCPTIVNQKEKEASCTDLKAPLDYDFTDEYITKGIRKIFTALRQVFKIPPTECRGFLSLDPEIPNSQINQLLESINFLGKLKLSYESISEYRELLYVPKEELAEKHKLIVGMKPKDINDFIPFYFLDISELLWVCKVSKKERFLIYEGNRIYYLSNKLKIEPSVVCKYISTHLFIYRINYKILNRNIDVLLEHKVEPMNILRDLWAIKYTSKLIESRLTRALNSEHTKVMPWMVRCCEQVFKKNLEKTVLEKSLLGPNINSVYYVAERLGYDVETTRNIMQKHPQTFSVRPTQLKQKLDYLLDELCLTPSDVAQVIRILCHSLRTTKQRIEYLKSIGCEPTSLVPLCKSKEEYRKYVNNYLNRSTSDKTSKENKNEDFISH